MSELQPYDFKLVLHQLREKLLCKITAIRNDDDSRAHYREAVDKSGQYMGIIADSTSYRREEEDDGALETLVMGIVTDKLMVRFHVYNSHNGYYGGLRPQLFISERSERVSG